MALQDLADELDEADDEEEEEDSGLGSFLKEKAEEIEKEESDDELEPIQGGEYTPQVYFHSSEDMKELDDESVHFAITSPPYNTGWNYGSYDDGLEYATEYLPMLARVFREVYRVLKPGGRFCVNVPSLLRAGASGGFPIAADITRMMTTDDNVFIGIEDDMPNDIPFDERPGHDIYQLGEQTNWIVREQIAWYKGFNTDGLAPNGSYPRPWGVLLNNMHEVIIVFQKPGKREFDDLKGELIERSKIVKKDEDMCDDVWHISPDSWSPKHVDDEDIPVFPEKLVRRAIKLWSYEEDVVLDPFAGRFTTGKVAKQERRHAVGYEIRKELERDIQRYTHKNQMGLFQFE